MTKTRPQIENEMAKEPHNHPQDAIDCRAGTRATATKLVPVEPTEEMIVAGAEDYRVDWPQQDIYGDMSETDKQAAARDIYRAMLSAAPEAPTSTVVAWGFFDKSGALRFVAPNAHDAHMRFIMSDADPDEFDVATAAKPLFTSPPTPEGWQDYTRPETDNEHIARDMRTKRFPGRSTARKVSTGQEPIAWLVSWSFRGINKRETYLDTKEGFAAYNDLLDNDNPDVEITPLVAASPSSGDGEKLRGALAELKRVTEHLATWAEYHPQERTAETDAAIYCARKIYAGDPQ